MCKKLLLISTIILFSLTGRADTLPTTIQGIGIKYAGQIIKVYKFADYITKKLQLLSIDTVNQQGAFKLTYNQTEPLLISVPLGIYNAVLFTEKGKTYNIILPPFQPKTKADILNPFFKTVEIYFGIKNIDSTNLNYQIAGFNELYHKYVDNNYNNIFKNPREANVDSVIQSIEDKFNTDTNTFFSNYRTYKYAWLKYSSYMRNPDYVIREYFHKKPFLYQNPAYMDLFNQLFTNYLALYMNTSEGERLYSDIAFAKSPVYVKQTFSNNMVLLNDTLQEFVLLKGLHDAFYQKTFPTPTMLITLDSVALTTKVPYHKAVAENIREKVLQAKSGFPTPKFELRDANGVFRLSSEYLANYVYLNFISVESFACQQDFELLKNLHEKHKKDFRIVSICIDDDFNKAVSLFKEKGYNWMLLSYRTQKTIVDDYKVRAYPAYYLINPDGKLGMSPAVSPGQNFEWHFFKMLQAKKKGQY